MRELVFVVEQEEDGGFVARAADESIFTQADSFNQLKSNIIEAVQVHLDPHAPPVRVRFQFGRVRTLSLIGYLAAVFSWILELCVLLLHIFTKIKLNTIGQTALFATTIAVSAFAWFRREDFRSLRSSGGRIPLSAAQMLIITVFVVAVGSLGTVICMLLFGK